MSNRQERFDAVEMMRSIRDRISAEIDGMSFEQERQWLAAQEIADPFLRRLKERAVPGGKTGSITRRSAVAHEEEKPYGAG